MFPFNIYNHLRGCFSQNGSRGLQGATRRHVEQQTGVDGDEEGADGGGTASQDSNTHERTHTWCVLTSAVGWLITKAATCLRCLANCEPEDKLDFWTRETRRGGRLTENSRNLIGEWGSGFVKARVMEGELKRTNQTAGGGIPYSLPGEAASPSSRLSSSVVWKSMMTPAPSSSSSSLLALAMLL